MNPDRPDITDQAIAWHLRQDVMSVEDWHDFTSWLEADPAHADAFDRIAQDDAVLMECLAPVVAPVAANDDTPLFGMRWRRWLAGGTAVAAAACAAYLVPGLLPRPAAPYEVATRAGERRDVALADGTRIQMSGETTLRLDHADPRRAELVTGEATFRVRHDAANPFVLRSGGQSVQDMGTVFNVVRAERRLSVQVAEGSVLFQPTAQAVKLTPGDALESIDGTDRVTLSHVDVDAVGGWRDGRLAFNAAPLADVVDAVRRQSGISIALGSTLAGRPFTGVLHLTGSADRDVSHLAALVGARARRETKGWVLEAAEDATP